MAPHIPDETLAATVAAAAATSAPDFKVKKDKKDKKSKAKDKDKDAKKKTSKDRKEKADKADRASSSFSASESPPYQNQTASTPAVTDPTPPASKKRSRPDPCSSSSSIPSSDHLNHHKLLKTSAHGHPIQVHPNYHKDHDIDISGTRNCPAPLPTWDSCRSLLAPVLVNALVQQDFPAPSPIQAQSWPLAMSGRDLISIAKTGSGKTLGFLIPILARILEEGVHGPPKMIGWKAGPVRPRAMVIAPTRELAQQIGAEAEKIIRSIPQLKVAVVYGGAGKIEQLRAFKQGADIVVGTPGRLKDFMISQKGYDPAILPDRIRTVVLDEADRMLDMGFEPDVTAILDLCPKPQPQDNPDLTWQHPAPLQDTNTRQTLMFTATWSKAVQQVANKFTARNAPRIRIGQDQDDKLVANKQVQQIVHVMDQSEKLNKLRQILRDEQIGMNDPDGSGPRRAIVFCGTKGQCDNLERIIHAPKPVSIHGDKQQFAREQALNAFKSGRSPLLIATDVAARGIDVPDVKLVVIFDFGTPKAAGSCDTYVHRIGRTGRAGQTGKAITLFTIENKDAAPQLVHIMTEAGSQVPPELQAMADSVPNRKGKGAASRYGNTRYGNAKSNHNFRGARGARGGGGRAGGFAGTRGGGGGGGSTGFRSAKAASTPTKQTFFS